MNDFGASHDFGKHKHKSTKSKGKTERRIWTRLDEKRVAKFEVMRNAFKDEAFGIEVFEYVYDNDSEVLRRIIDMGYAYWLVNEEQKKSKKKNERNND